MNTELVSRRDSDPGLRLLRGLNATAGWDSQLLAFFLSLRLHDVSCKSKKHQVWRVARFSQSQRHLEMEVNLRRDYTKIGHMQVLRKR